MRPLLTFELWGIASIVWPSPRIFSIQAHKSSGLGESTALNGMGAVFPLKMTSFPAQRIGIPNRGILRDGFKADIVVFDKHNVKTRATKQNPKVYPEGIPYVIVNGNVVIDEGKHTGKFPGRGIGRGRWN